MCRIRIAQIGHPDQSQGMPVQAIKLGVKCEEINVVSTDGWSATHAHEAMGIAFTGRYMPLKLRFSLASRSINLEELAAGGTWCSRAIGETDINLAFHQRRD